MRLSDVIRGYRYVWRHVPRGGYGFAILLPVTVRRIGKSRVTVEVEVTGKLVAVSPASLRDADMRDARPELETGR